MHFDHSNTPAADKKNITNIATEIRITTISQPDQYSLYFPPKSNFPADGFLSSADKVGINTIILHKLLMPSLFGDPALVKHDDVVRIAICFESVCDHDDSLILCECFDCPLQSVFVFGINICCCLIKYDNRSIPNKTFPDFFQGVRLQKVHAHGRPHAS